jgi:hypothetical protein
MPTVLKQNTSITFLEKLLTLFATWVAAPEDNDKDTEYTAESLINNFDSLTKTFRSLNRTQQTQLFVCLCKGLKINTRYVANIVPMKLSPGENKTMISYMEKGQRVGPWVEVYSLEEQRWVAVSPTLQLVDQPLIFSQGCVVYTLAFANDYIKDVTKRYTNKWLSVRKLRLDDAWLSKLLLSHSTVDLTYDFLVTNQEITVGNEFKRK